MSWPLLPSRVGILFAMVELKPKEMTPVINRLERAEGQLTAIARMTEEGRDCDGMPDPTGRR